MGGFRGGSSAAPGKPPDTVDAVWPINPESNGVFER